MLIITRSQGSPNNFVLAKYEFDIFAEKAGILLLGRLLPRSIKANLNPNLFQELAALKPHDADKIHVNLLWEAGIPLEVVAGQYIGRGEGIGLMERGWLDINTIKKHHLSLTQRSERFQELMQQVQQYSTRFNGGHLYLNNNQVFMFNGCRLKFPVLKFQNLTL